MSGMDRSSLDAWRQHNTRDIPVSEHLSMRVRHYDVLALIAGDDGADNPLLNVIARAAGVGSSEQPGQLMNSPETLKALATTLNNLLIKVVISPQLLEQGHKDGISVTEIPFEYKMRVFEAMIDAEGLPRAAEFPYGSGGGVVAGPTG